MTTMVVPLDGSAFAERAIRPACSIAARLEQARVLLVSCAPDDIDAAQRELDDRARLYSEVVDIETRIVGHGDPAEVLLAIAATEPDGMLCMATRGKGAIRGKGTGQRLHEGRLRIDAAVHPRWPELQNHASTGRARSAPGVLGWLRVVRQHRPRGRHVV